MVEVVACAIEHHGNRLIPGRALRSRTHGPIHIVPGQVGEQSGSLMCSKPLRIASAVVKIIATRIMQQTGAPKIATALAEFAALVTIVAGEIEQGAETS